MVLVKNNKASLKTVRPKKKVAKHFNKKYFDKTERTKYLKLLKWNKFECPVKQKIFAPDYPLAYYLAYTNNEEKCVVSWNSVKIFTCSNPFLETTCLGFISYNKENSKYYEKSSYIIYNNIFKHKNLVKQLGLDFLNPNVDVHIIKKKSSELLLKGEITNSMDLLKHYLKTSHKIYTRKIPFKLLYQELNRPYRDWSNRTIFKLLKTCSNLETHIRNIPNIFNYNHIEDLIDQVTLFNEKINYNVSEKKLNEIHSKYSKRISDIKLESIERVEIKFKNPVPKRADIQLLTSNIDFFNEGLEMEHCLASPYYFTKAKTKKMFYFRYDKIERGTAEVCLIDQRLLITQFVGKRNKLISQKAIKYISSFISSTFSSFLIKEGILNTDQSKEILISLTDNEAPF